jgi:YidC/Oxa1 family membrane protein insertase
MFRDRTTLIVVSLAVIGLVASIFWQQQETVKAKLAFERQRALAGASVSPNPTGSTGPSATASAPSIAAAPATSPTLPDLPAAPETPVALKGPVSVLKFSNNRGGLQRISLLSHKAEGEQPVELNNDQAPAIGAITQTLDNWRDSGYEITADQAAGSVTLKRDIPGQLAVTKVFTLASPAGLKDEYQIKLAVSFRNNEPTDVTIPGYFISTGGAQPIHRTDFAQRTVFDWYRDGKFSSINVGWFDPSSFFWVVQTRSARDMYLESANAILWAAVGSQYFTTILSPDNETGKQVWARRVFLPVEDGQQGPSSMEGALGMPGFTLKPGESKTTNFLIYAGPKELSRLNRLPNNQVAVLNFSIWTPICKILLTGLNTIHAFVGNYALSIIILTILIRLLIWPLQNASMKSMRKMAKLSPIMNELREKYKDDPQRLNQEVMKVYKEYGVNPVGGCLPLLVQMPIFASFFTLLGSTIELRNSSFLWVQDLSQPDTVAHIFGLPINILPLVMVAAQVWQMRITPKTGDPAQQRLLYFTPLIFLFFCYNYASGLSLYWTVSTLFTVVQTYLTRNQTEPQLTKAPARPVVAKKKTYR